MSTGRRCLQFDRLVAKRMRCNGHGSTGRGGDDLYVWRTFDRLIWFEKWVHEQSMQAEHTSALAELENAPPLIIQVGPTSASTVHYATFRWTCSANMQYVKCGMQPATCTQAMCNTQHTMHSRRDGTMQHAACSTTRPATTDRRTRMNPTTYSAPLPQCAPSQAVRTASGVRITWQPGDGDEPLLRSGVQIRWTARKNELLEADVSRRCFCVRMPRRCRDVCGFDVLCYVKGKPAARCVQRGGRGLGGGRGRDDARARLSCAALRYQCSQAEPCPQLYCTGSK